MPAEHYRYNEHGEVGLYQGYYCGSCGAGGMSMVGGSHRCSPNPDLVAELKKLNSHPKPKVHTMPFIGDAGESDNGKLPAHTPSDDWLAHHKKVYLAGLTQHRKALIQQLKEVDEEIYNTNKA